ncbi:TRICHOME BIREFRINGENCE-LIKE 34 [Perilla frutescens var. hirtella]|uniref:TRICHOME BIREFRINGENCE-LIKE 34 n=1 Tax=Perilla frutescens var. hirtella TaxID=608512 RepID=A0AAD4PFU5_PERFH|nr:TRICHOME BIREFRINGENCE-LIKE 34 [Perilla frutescens var. hirtella]
MSSNVTLLKMNKKTNLEKLIFRFKSHFVAAFFLIAFFTTTVYLTVDNGGIVKEQESQQEHLSALQEYRETRKERDENVNHVVSANKTTVTTRCDLSSGRWIYDNVSRPLYEEGQCPFTNDDFACEKHGRKDVEYQKWRWQPHDCDLPRVTSIESHARHWTDADILIFDSFMWWLEPTMTLLWGSFGSSDAIYKRVEMRPRRYEMALNTWSDWLEFNINRTKTNLFFVSLSPFHSFGESWDDRSYCYSETEPVLKDEYWGIATDREMMSVAESILHKLETRGLNITYLNITNLSDYRKDAHLSIYRKFYEPLSEEQLSNPISYSDCIHWCLPGVPDVWNEIFYYYIIDS